MKQHRYRITVEHLADQNGAPSTHAAPLQFEAGNHDDILAVVERIRSRGDLPAESATAFAVGLKLFGEVMLENRQHPLFADFLPQFGQFMKQLKKGPDMPA
jgi:hypothetical protein